MTLLSGRLTKKNGTKGIKRRKRREKRTGIDASTTYSSVCVSYFVMDQVCLEGQMNAVLSAAVAALGFWLIAVALASPTGGLVLGTIGGFLFAIGAILFYAFTRGDHDE